MRKSSKVTLQDVAQEAGVSNPLVSAILSGRRSTVCYSDKTKAKVEAAARRMGFRHCILAQSFRANRSFFVGVLQPTVYHWFSAHLLRGIQQELALAGLTPIFLSQADGKEEEKNLDVLEGRQVEAILTGTMGQCSSRYGALVKAGIPVIQIQDDVLAKVGVPHIKCDYDMAGYEAARHLIGLGHRRIALLTHTQYKANWDAHDQWHGYGRAMREAGLKPMVVAHGLDRFVVGDRYSFYHCVEEVMDALLGPVDAPKRKALAGPDLPTGVVCYASGQALALLDGARARGIRVPEDFSVVGFLDLGNRNITTPALTTVDVNAFELGRAAARAAMDLLAKKPADLRAISPHFILRGSTGPMKNQPQKATG